MSDANKMLSHYIDCFRNGDRLDADVLDEIVHIALSDGKLDNDERQALKEIIIALDSKDLTPSLWGRIEALVKQFSLDES